MGTAAQCGFTWGRCVCVGRLSIAATLKDGSFGMCRLPDRFAAGNTHICLFPRGRRLAGWRIGLSTNCRLVRWGIFWEARQCGGNWPRCLSTGIAGRRRRCGRGRNAILESEDSDRSLCGCRGGSETRLHGTEKRLGGGRGGTDGGGFGRAWFFVCFG